jgi:hypothetical protein
MLEIIALIFLTRKNGELAVQKGLKPGSWKLFTVLGWIGGEIAGIIGGVLIFGEDSLFPAILLAYGMAISSYFIIRSVLSKKPDHYEDEINSIGVNDLRP